MNWNLKNNFNIEKIKNIYMKNKQWKRNFHLIYKRYIPKKNR